MSSITDAAESGTEASLQWRNGQLCCSKSILGFRLYALHDEQLYRYSLAVSQLHVRLLFNHTQGELTDILRLRGGLRYLDTAASNNNNALTSGLDPAGARPASGNFPILPVASNGALSVDAEGIALMNDGTFWISEEYGPSVYHIAANGESCHST